MLSSENAKNVSKPRMSLRMRQAIGLGFALGAGIMMVIIGIAHF